MDAADRAREAGAHKEHGEDEEQNTIFEEEEDIYV